MFGFVDLPNSQVIMLLLIKPSERSLSHICDTRQTISKPDLYRVYPTNLKTCLGLAICCPQKWPPVQFAKDGVGVVEADLVREV